MPTSSNIEKFSVRKFEATDLWRMNIYGATLAGLGGSILLCVVAGSVFSEGIGLDQASLLAGAMILGVIIWVLCWYPGNLAVVHPIAVEIEEGKGLHLFAPMKTVYIPSDDLNRVQRSYLHLGWVVKLHRRHGALTRFYIHGAFGRQGGELARAIQEEIDRRGI